MKSTGLKSIRTDLRLSKAKSRNATSNTATEIFQENNLLLTEISFLKIKIDCLFQVQNHSQVIYKINPNWIYFLMSQKKLAFFLV